MEAKMAISWSSRNQRLVVFSAGMFSKLADSSDDDDEEEELRGYLKEAKQVMGSNPCCGKGFFLMQHPSLSCVMYWVSCL